MALSPRLRNEARSGAFMGKQPRKVNQGKRPIPPVKRGKLPESGTRDTSLSMNDRDRRPPFRKGGGKSFEKGRKSGPRPASRSSWRDRDSGGDGPAILYGW